MSFAMIPANEPMPLGGGASIDPATWPGRLAAAARRLLGRTVYLLAGFPLGIASFVVVVVGLSAGLGTLITFLGLPILFVTIQAARMLAAGERGLLSSLLGRDVPPTVYLRAAADDTPVRRLVQPLKDPQSRRDVVHGLVTFPVSVLGFVVAVVWWTVALGGTTWYAWGWMLPQGPDSEDLPELLGLGESYLVRAGFYSAFGLLAAVTLPLAITGAASLRSVLADALLVGPTRHRRQVDTLVEGRAAARAAEDSALRRLERDIHDGPQQRLVRLSMDLGRAKQKVGDDAPELAAAIDEARQQTQETLDELRALSRGIAPPILADRGLTSALEELAVRSAIPTGCRVELVDDRLPAHVETAAYFVVAEALANAAKHSGATMATVVALQADGVLTVDVTDDGAGGAHPAKGHGLAGLDQRVRAVDGRLTITSPPGGPTTVAAEVPCES
ncbi:MAG: sensor domain-containing protein [Actinomycetota bacterium]